MLFTYSDILIISSISLLLALGSPACVPLMNLKKGAKNYKQCSMHAVIIPHYIIYNKNDWLISMGYIVS